MTKFQHDLAKIWWGILMEALPFSKGTSIPSLRVSRIVLIVPQATKEAHAKDFAKF